MVVSFQQLQAATTRVFGRRSTMTVPYPQSSSLKFSTSTTAAIAAVRGRSPRHHLGVVIAFGAVMGGYNLLSRVDDVRELSSSSSSFVSSLSLLLTSSSTATMIAWNHCQVPCGIFDDPAMITGLQQACQTIRKAVVESNKLHTDYVDTTPLNSNQFVRWVMTKEQHANQIITTVSEYCLCQRVKRGAFATDDEYLCALKSHHQVLLAAMKTKQSMSLEDCDALEQAIHSMTRMYTTK